MNAYENDAAAQAILNTVPDADALLAVLRNLRIETPSWAYADGGTRFGIFEQPSAARTIEHKLADAAMVHKVTGIAPSVAVHVLWDFPDGFDPKLIDVARELGIAIGAINPTIFQDACYKYGSLANRDDDARQQAIDHCVASVKLAEQVGTKYISLWLADGTNYPGQDDIAERRLRLIDSLKQIHAAVTGDQQLLLEYKPFEPAFYHTDIADWGMAMSLCRNAGANAKVLVDIGHHYQGQNIEQIVTWLIEEGMLGGFHFNDRRYADDDLTTGSIDPYQMFRIFHEIVTAGDIRNRDTDIAYMVDQSHNLKPKVLAMVQTVDTIHQLYAKALLVDRKALREAQAGTDIVAAEEILRNAYLTDTRPLIGTIRKKMNLAPDAIDAFRNSNYEQRAAEERI